MVTAHVCSRFNAASARAGSSGVRLTSSLARPVLLPQHQHVYIRITSSAFSSCASRSSSSPSPKPAVRQNPSSSSPAVKDSSDSLNPPPSTLPAPFEPPEKPASAGVGYYVSLGRAYYAFYKTGIKNAWGNYLAVRERSRTGQVPTRLNARNPGGVPVVSISTVLRYLRTGGGAGRDGALYTDSSITSAQRHRSHLLEQTTGSSLSRADYQLLLRTARDKRRIVPFILVLFICGEFTPLVVASGLLTPPRTCVLPSQTQKALDRRVQVADKATGFVDATKTDNNGRPVYTLFGRIGVPPFPERAVERASAEDVLCTAAVMLEPYGSRRRGVSALHDAGAWGSLSPWRRRLKTMGMRLVLARHLGYIALDDALISRGGGGGGGGGGVRDLSADEVALAVGERGGVRVGYGLDAGRAETVQREWLEKWVRASEQGWKE